MQSCMNICKNLLIEDSIKKWRKGNIHILETKDLLQEDSLKNRRKGNIHIMETKDLLQKKKGNIRILFKKNS